VRALHLPCGTPSPGRGPRWRERGREQDAGVVAQAAFAQAEQGQGLRPAAQRRWQQQRQHCTHACLAQRVAAEVLHITSLRSSGTVAFVHVQAGIAQQIAAVGQCSQARMLWIGVIASGGVGLRLSSGSTAHMQASPSPLPQ